MVRIEVVCDGCMYKQWVVRGGPGGDFPTCPKCYCMMVPTGNVKDSE